MDEEKRPEGGLVSHAEAYDQESHVLDSPAVNGLEYVTRKCESVPTRELGCTCTGAPWTYSTSGNTYAGFYCKAYLIKRGRAAERCELLTPNG